MCSCLTLITKVIRGGNRQTTTRYPMPQLLVVNLVGLIIYGTRKVHARK